MEHFISFGKMALKEVMEAVDIIMEGELEMQVGEVVLLTPGMISVVPSNTPHRAKAISDCNVITILHPRRSDLKQTKIISSE